MSIAVVFPGQGAQAVGMGRALAESDSEIMDLFIRASDCLGFDLARVCFEGPAEDLTRSDRAQPAIFVASVAAWTALVKARPDLAFEAMAGLSSGEWCALHAAGVVGYEHTLKILEARGRLMQVACQETPGSMLTVIGLDPEACREVAEACGIQVANYNSPQQTVLSGALEGIEAAETKAKEGGAKIAKRLNVAGAFHSKLMKSAEEKFAETLASFEFEMPKVPVWSNVTGAVHEDPASIKSLMAKQITGSVQWVKTIQDVAGKGVTSFVELGPGKVLSGLIKRIDNSVSLHNIQDPTDLATVTASLN